MEQKEHLIKKKNKGGKTEKNGRHKKKGIKTEKTK